MKLKNGLVNNKTKICCEDSIKTLKREDGVVEKSKIFQKLTIKDIVFLAVTSAVLILTCGVMPLFAELTKVVFGIAQLVTALQMSLFCTIGLMKVRKTFTITLMLIFMGVIMVMMAPIMFLSNIFVAVVIETIIILIFRNYKKDIACFVGGMLTAPLSLPMYIVYNYITAPEVFTTVMSNTWLIIGMTIAIVLLSTIGAFLGMKIGKELSRAGVLKKNGKV